MKKYLYLFFRKMLPSAVANYLGKINDYPQFSLWILITLAKIYFFHVFLIWRKHVCILLAPFVMSLRHPTAASVVQFCDGAQLHVCTRLVFNPMQGALKYPHLSSEALMLTLSFLKTL